MTKKISKASSKTEVDCKQFVQECSQHEHGSFVGDQEYWHDELAFKIARSGCFGGNWLVTRFLNNIPCPSVICALSSVKEPVLKKHRIEIKEKLGNLIYNSQDAKIRVASIHALCSLKIIDFNILPFVEDDDVYVASSAIHYLGELYPGESIDLFKQLLSSENPLIIQSVLDELDQPCFVQYIPLVQKFVNHENSDVSAAATTTLDNLFYYRGV